MHFRAAALSDRGRVRAENEDACLARSEQGLFLVADGLGGHRAGAVAAQAIVETLPAFLAEDLAGGACTPRRAASALRRVLSQLSSELRERGRRYPELTGMGATVVVGFGVGARLCVAHLGDSRAYLMRGGRLRCLTRDHNVAGELVRGGFLTAAEARDHEARHHITRYVGMDGDAMPDVRTIGLHDGDRLLLCSDGLTAMVTDAHIRRLLDGEPDPEVACRALVEEANAAGGYDNVSTIVVDVGMRRTVS